MRSILFLLFLVASVGVQAQPFDGSFNRFNIDEIQLKDSMVTKKWFVSRHTAIAAGYIGFSGRSVSYVSAPMGLQLNRTLNKNFNAFAGVSIAPTFFNTNQMFTTDAGKGFSNNFMTGNPSRFTINPAAYAGIGYTNDAGTFQIQGRVIVDRGNYFTNPTAFGSPYQLDRQMRNLPFQNQSIRF